ncbi:hypothetical protein H5410_017561 [Solanum commersonii]|uniref:Uncharacterized protein n=1 Tax=Solanum commersonii TaxID=4109 RepID=A0A9J5ZZN5_SOLCO|nr:hypothetical protein H5410_017561 [Solanum commersonii]
MPFFYPCQFWQNQQIGIALNFLAEQRKWLVMGLRNLIFGERNYVKLITKEKNLIIRAKVASTLR